MNSALSSTNGSQGTARWSLRLLGGFDLVSLPGRERFALPGKRERLLLAYLALSPNGRVSRRKLISLLWEDAEEEAALHSLRNCLSVLRKALGDANHRTLSSQGEDIVLDLSALDTDVLAFRRLAAHQGRAELKAAAELCSGDLLDGLGIESEAFESWRRTESACHRNQSVDVLVRLMAQFEEAGETERAIETGTRILGFEPLHEVAARRLMRLYGRSGRRGAAMAVYHSLAATLRGEVGAEPEAETRALFADLSRGTEASIAPRFSTGGDLTPPREVVPRADKVHILSSITVTPGRSGYKLVGIVGAILFGAGLAMFLGSQFLSPSHVTGTQAADASNTWTSVSRDAVTIAVLPFANLSGGASQGSFSDGMTEEINTALAKVSGLNVVARTSAFAFKGQNIDARTVGPILGATHLIEGSVRKAGQRVRIAVQLVRSNDGVQLWSQSYERDLTEIFAIQEEIAKSIIASLRVPLGLSQDESLVNNRSIDPDSYERYLRGKSLFLARGGVPAGTQDRNLTEAATLLEDVVAKNPTYAPAWSFLGGTYFGLAARSATPAGIVDARAVTNEFRIKGEAAGQKSAQLDANLVMAYNVLGVFAWSRAKPLEAEELYEKALALDPVEPNTLGAYAIRLGSAGRLKEALDLAERALQVEPFYPNVARVTAEDRWLNGHSESAVALAQTLRPSDRATLVALIYASMRRFGEAADSLMELAAVDAHSDAARAARLLRMAPAQPPSAEELPRLPPRLSMLYLYLGAPERALQGYERIVDIGFLSGNQSAVWHADYAPVRKTVRFKALMRKAGLVEYWRVKGWPKQCHSTTADDFECD